ncbi:hypothetical protein NLU13_7436 [Sarocladium strictum]|uniref:COP9 signalosome complex subunit 3 N-terminal helical repeats domain-containing protein n=1 Tax=Sarocladium strictum TaxID=5046 RepID=A0AA39GDZ8_SARSR|nr:hypothetical protein NLU13_7436 [Sarocladium strictum]
MDKLQAILLGSPSLQGSHQAYRDLDVELRSQAEAVTKQLPETARALITAHPQEILEWLSPAQHTISYAAVLDVLVRPETTIDRAWLQNKVEAFLEGFDWIHIRFIGDALTRLLSRISVMGLFKPQRTIELLASTILRVDPTASVFTSSHLVLANHALTLGIVDPALPVLDRDITAYPPTTSVRGGRPLSDPSLSATIYISTFTGLTEPVKASMILDYGATLSQIYISRKDWQKAKASLEQVITHPSKDKGVVKAMTSAYRRWILVSLLEGGKSPLLPSYTPSTAKSHYVSQVPYNALANTFEASDPAQLQTELKTHEATYESDGTLALVQQVLQAYQKWQVINLRLSYLRISISRVREETFSGETGQRLPSTEAVDALLREMIEAGMLKARFELDEHGNETYLAFEEDTNTLSETEFAQEIARRHKAISDLTAQYKVVNERLSANKEYAKYVYREQKRQNDEGNQPIGFDASVEDEDLMSGILKAS